MMRHPCYPIIGVALSFSLLLVAACGGGLLGKGTQEKTRFYQLHAATASSRTEGRFEAVEESVAIALSLDSFPEYLARSQIVTRTSDNKLELAQFDHWAESLQRNFVRVLVLNLTYQLSTDRIYVFPWRKNRPIDFELLVDVAHFEGEFGGDVLLQARWSIYDSRGRKELYTAGATFIEPAAAKEYEAQVAAMSRLLERLSGDIADSIEKIQREVSG
jgi:uncharacterized lipoprotein YmbA